MGRRAALSGTPGTGKSTVARLLTPSLSVVEVGDLGRRFDCARMRGGGLEVDLPKLVRKLRSRPSRFHADIVVGHLAHLLPVRDVVVLRCHPVELERRLRSSRHGDMRSRRENLLSETLNLVTAEAVGQRRRVFEVDTTGRRPSDVAREVASWLRGPRPSRWGRVDWIADPAVTEQLLEWAG